MSKDTALQSYVDAFLKENMVHNLSSARTEEKVWEHVHDSLALDDLDLPVKAKVLDVGSGGGLPGVPLAIAHPEWDVTLLDSVTKKAEAVNRIIESVQSVQPVKAFAIAGRAEELGRSKEHRFQYDLVVARAVAALPTLLEYVVPFMKQNGVAVLYKGPSAIEEIAQSKRALEQLNARLNQVESYEAEVSEETKQRNRVNASFASELQDGALAEKGSDIPQKLFLVVRRDGLLEDQYPRKNGMPKKRPL